MALLPLRVLVEDGWVDALIPLQMITSFIRLPSSKTRITLTCGSMYQTDKSFDELTKMITGSPLALPR